MHMNRSCRRGYVPLASNDNGSSRQSLCWGSVFNYYSFPPWLPVQTSKGMTFRFGKVKQKKRRVSPACSFVHKSNFLKIVNLLLSLLFYCLAWHSVLLLLFCVARIHQPGCACPCHMSDICWIPPLLEYSTMVIFVSLLEILYILTQIYY